MKYKPDPAIPVSLKLRQAIADQHSAPQRDRTDLEHRIATNREALQQQEAIRQAFWNVTRQSQHQQEQVTQQESPNSSEKDKKE